jgi:hypothetical protein
MAHLFHGPCPPQKKTGLFSAWSMWHSVDFLVGGFNPSEKYESQSGFLFPTYGKIKFMFQTTNRFSG